MNESVNHPAPIEIEIYGQKFRLRAPVEEHDRIYQAARHVDNVLREVVTSQTTMDTARLAIQAAFLIALEYLKLMDDIHAEAGLTQEVKQRVDQLTRRIEEFLKSQ